jgi:hypothetical protein
MDKIHLLDATNLVPSRLRETGTPSAANHDDTTQGKPHQAWTNNDASGD